MPEAAAEEIRHWSDHPGFNSVLLVTNPLGRPFGHPVYEPIYRAAVQAGLPVAVHASGDAVGKGQESAGGNSATMLERYAASFGAPGMHHLSSMITQGLFGRFPTLQVALLEFGFTWLPALIWRNGISSNAKTPIPSRTCTASASRKNSAGRERSARRGAGCRPP